jgi:hypothetical protein
MFCGPHPANSAVEPRFELNWYQVMSIDKEPSSVLTDPTTQRLVTLRGPQWPWQPSSNSTDLSNNLCVAIVRGAVAAHRRTIRLESPRGSAWTGGSRPGALLGGGAKPGDTPY